MDPYSEYNWGQRFGSTVIPLEIWDCPGNITVETLGTPLSHFRTIIFVIDIRVSSLYTRYFLFIHDRLSAGPI